MRQALFHLCLVAVLLGGAFAARAWGDPSDGPLRFGTGDIPKFTQQQVNRTSPRTVQLIIEAIRTSTDSRRIELVADLGACRTSAAEKALCDLLNDSSATVRAQAACSLGEIGDRAAISNIRAVYHDPDASVRREAIVAGAALGDVEATTAGLADSDEAVIQAACTHLSDSQSVSKVCDALRSLPAQVRVAALESLAMSPPPRDKWETIAGGLNGEVSQRYAALSVLAAIGDVESSPAINSCLSDQSSVVRTEAVLALGQTALVSERQTVAIHMLADPDLAVRCAAAEVLAASPTDRAISLLVGQLSMKNGPLRDAARRALIAIGPASIPAAKQLLAATDDERKIDGSFILGALRSRDGVNEQIALLNSSNWKLVLQAAKSLDQIGDRSAGAGLAAVVAKFPQAQDADGALAGIGASIVSAARLGYSPLLPKIQALITQQDCPAEVRDAAIYGVGLLGTASDHAACDKIVSIGLDPQEAMPTRMEAIKALGHLRYGPAAATLADMAETQGNLAMRWLAHWADERVTGKKSEFHLPAQEWSADVAISDLGEATSERQLSGTLGFGGSYLAGAWVPVHLMVRNGHSEPIDGSMSFPVSSGGLNAVVRMPCEIPAQSAVRLTAYGYFGSKSGSGQSSSVATTADWTTGDGRRIFRAPIAAAPLSARDGFSAQSAQSLDTLMLCLVDPGDDSADSSAAQGAARLARSISERIGFAVKAQMLAIGDAPRDAVGYDSSRVVVLQADPEKLDIAQRRALLDHIRMGGELLVCGTPISPATWISAYEPVIPLGRREVATVENASDGARYPLAAPSMIMEASDVAGADTNVLVADPQLIHVASRPVGLGRVVFTSFPIDALDTQDAGNAELWKKLLLLSASSSRSLPASAAEPLGQLVGTPTAPLSIPIAVVGAYIATLFISQRYFAGGSRPWAFGVTVGVGVVGFVALAAVSAMRTAHEELNGGRISMLALGPSGGGRQEELFAFAGTDNSSLQVTAGESATIRPVTSSERKEIQIRELPFEISQARVHPMEITQIWSAQRPVESTRQVRATARFGPDGLAVSVSNGLEMPLRNSLLLWGAAWSLGDVAQSESQLAPRHRAAAGEFVAVDSVHSDIDAIRSKVIERVVSSNRAAINADDEPVLMGWADELPGCVRAPDAKMNNIGLVCAPVEVVPSEAGATVKIDGAFCRLIAGPGAAPPFDKARRQWIATNQSGDWIIGFAAPAKIGRLRPEHVTLSADVSAPTQTITISRVLCDAVGPKADAAGMALAQWRQPIGSESAAFDCTGGDFDSLGRVWIRLHVESSLPTPSTWFFRRLELSYTATVMNGSARSSGKNDTE